MTADLFELTPPSLYVTPNGEGMNGHLNPRSTSTDVWLTPPEILAALGAFDLDPCAAPEPRPWPTATRHIALPANGLFEPWEGRVWLNPPYNDQIGRWMGRLVAHGNGIALIFSRTDTEMFHRCIWDAATAALFLKGRLTFHHLNGRRGGKNSGAPSVLVAYGERNAVTLRQSGLPGKFIQLGARGD